MFSASCKYGIRAVMFLALYSYESKKIRVEEMAKELDIPKAFLAKVLGLLTKSGVIASSKGRNGGFYMTDLDKQSDFMSVIYAIDGEESMTHCVLGIKECSLDDVCPFHETVLKFRSIFQESLMSQSIEEFAHKMDADKLRISEL